MAVGAGLAVGCGWSCGLWLRFRRGVGFVKHALHVGLLPDLAFSLYNNNATCSYSYRLFITDIAQLVGYPYSCAY